MSLPKKTPRDSTNYTVKVSITGYRIKSVPHPRSHPSECTKESTSLLWQRSQGCLNSIQSGKKKSDKFKLSNTLQNIWLFFFSKSMKTMKNKKSQILGWRKDSSDETDGIKARSTDSLVVLAVYCVSQQYYTVDSGSQCCCFVETVASFCLHMHNWDGTQVIRLIQQALYLLILLSGPDFGVLTIALWLY